MKPTINPSVCRGFIEAILSDCLPKSDYRTRLETIIKACYRQVPDETPIEFLPMVIYHSIAGKGIQKAIPVTAAWRMVRLAAKLFDDAEDGDAQDCAGETINLGTGCLCAAYAALDRLAEYQCPQAPIDQIRISFSRACLHACSGQHNDLTAQLDHADLDPDGWLAIAFEKSGELFAWASWAGAVMAGADQAICEKFRQFGLHLGAMVQIADDFNGIWGKASGLDLGKNTFPLPIAYARYVSRGQEWETLLALLEGARQRNLDSIQKAREFLTALGAQKYLLSAAWIQRRVAMQTLEDAPIASTAKSELAALFRMVFPALDGLIPLSYENCAGTAPG